MGSRKRKKKAPPARLAAYVVPGFFEPGNSYVLYVLEEYRYRICRKDPDGVKTVGEWQDYDGQGSPLPRSYEEVIEVPNLTRYFYRIFFNPNLKQCNE